MRDPLELAEHRLKMTLMAADLENKRMDTLHKAEMRRWEPLKVMIAAIAAAGGLLIAGGTFAKLFL